MSIIATIITAVLITIFLLFGLTVFRGAPYVPSQRKYIKRAFENLYPLGPKDVLVDIGSGDGVVLRMAARFGAKAIGYELNPLLVWLSRLLARPFGKRIEVRLIDFWFAPLPNDVTVIYLFAVTRDRKRITRKLQKEVDRIGHPVSVLTLGSGLDVEAADAEFDAYHRYTLQPANRHV
jgi:SAM-dependent methyltransferase